MTVLAADGPRRAKRDRLSSKQRKKSGKQVTDVGKKKPKNCNSVCRDCSLKQSVPGKSFLQASVSRCVACGGQLDRVRLLKLTKKVRKELDSEANCS